jgi:hypothetical protein
MDNIFKDKAKEEEANISGISNKTIKARLE